jgi:hypothetical protein
VQYLDPIAVIDIELAIDQDQVDRLLLKCRKGVGQVIGLENLYIEMLTKHPA